MERSLKSSKKIISNSFKMPEEVAMTTIPKEKSQKIITVEQNLKYHTFTLKTKGITNQV